MIQDFLPGYKQTAGSGTDKRMPHHLWGVARRASALSPEQGFLNGYGTLDHCKRWQNAKGKTVVTSEPYEVDQERLKQICETYHLKATVYPRGSGDHHERTFLIIFERADGYVVNRGLQ